MWPNLPNLRLVLRLFCCLLLPLVGVGAEETNAIFAKRAEQAYLLAVKDFNTQTNSPQVALAAAIASFDWSEFATNDTQLAEIARQGIQACRRLLAKETNSGAGHYYLAMNLGKLAKAEAPSLSAYRRVHEVEDEFLKATQLDAHYDYAGPARNLGQLYFQAPGWPLSIGSKSKARQWFELAVKLEPGYPENQLKLAEARLQWRQREELENSLKSIAAIWPAARTNFVGAAWEQRWPDWDARKNTLEADYRKLYGPIP